MTVKVSLKGAGKPIDLEEKLPELAAGQTKTVSVPLSSTPPAGQPVTIQITIAAVPGEKKTDNNKGSFPAVFSSESVPHGRRLGRAECVRDLATAL